MIDITLNEIAGHAGFALSAVAYAMRKIVWLRAFALVSLGLSLYYNLTLEGGVLWLVVFWLTVFIAINLAQITFDIIENIEASMTPEMKRVMSVAFPKMHSRDWIRLIKAGRITQHRHGEVLLDIGDQTEEIAILLNGGTIEARDGVAPVQRDAGIFWGELTFFLGSDEFRRGSPVKITASAPGATILRVAYKDLQPLAHGSERLRAALAEGVVRSAGIKHSVITWGQPAAKRRDYMTEAT